MEVMRVAPGAAPKTLPLPRSKTPKPVELPPIPDNPTFHNNDLLFAHYAAKPTIELRNLIANVNRLLVRAIAREICRNPSDLDDYIQIGTLALMDAIEGFDPTRGSDFSSYAGKAIRRWIALSQAESRGLNEENATRLRLYKQALRHYGVKSFDDLAETPEDSLAKLNAFVESKWRAIKMKQRPSGGSCTVDTSRPSKDSRYAPFTLTVVKGLKWLDRATSKPLPLKEEHLPVREKALPTDDVPPDNSDSDHTARVSEILKRHLTPRQLEVVDLSGLHGIKIDPAEIAEKLGITKSAVSQLLERAYERLRRSESDLGGRHRTKP